MWTELSATGELASRLPVSFELGMIVIVTALVVALPIGVYSGIRQDTAGDHIGRTVAILAISVPHFWVGTLVVVFPAIWWGWSPPVKLIPFTEEPAANLVQFVIPGIIMGLIMTGTTMRLTRIRI